MIVFAACATFALATLVYVFWVPMQFEASPEKTRVAYLLERKEAVYENLRDLNFEYKAGKFPESDYQGMKTALETEAAGNRNHRSCCCCASAYSADPKRAG